MIIPRSPTLRTEDFPAENQNWISRLLSPLNTFITSVTSAINGGLTFQDNMTGQQKTVIFTYASNTLPLTFQLSFAGIPQSLQVVKATENGSPTIIQAAWSTSNKTVTISDLVKLSSGVASQLTQGAAYNLTVRIAA